MTARTRAALRGDWAASAALALLVDALLGDTPLVPHPVAVFGQAMTRAEVHLYRDRRTAGLVYAAAGVCAAAAAGSITALVPGGAVATGYVTIAGRGLWDAASAVGTALELGDLETARTLLPALVGRDPSELDAGEIVRAAVESVAENTVDGVVAPALYAAVTGPAGAAAYRAVNTLDSMVGYRDERYRRFGWASARLDDAANLVPARITGLLVAVVRPARARAIWQAVRREAPGHPSPNAGVAEAAFAAALGVRLGGVNVYGGEAEHRPLMGAASARLPERGDISRAIRCSQHVTAVLGALLMAAAAAKDGRTPAVSGRAAPLRGPE